MLFAPGIAPAGVLVLGVSDAAISNGSDSQGVAGHVEAQFLNFESGVSPTLSLSWHLPGGSSYSYSVLSIGARAVILSSQPPYFLAGVSAGLGNRWGGGVSEGTLPPELHDEAFLALSGKVGAVVPIVKRLSWVPTVGILWMRHEGAAGASEDIGPGWFFNLVALGIDVGD
jgi:hypothetical protein